MYPSGQAGTGVGDEVALEPDPFDDDLDEQLAAAAPRRMASRSTLTLAGLVLVVGGFFAGAQVQKHFGVAGSPGGTTPAANGQPGQARSGGQNQAGPNRPGAAAAGNVTTGTVVLVDGSTVYVKMANGTTVTVRTSGTTTVQAAQASKLSELAPGATVTVEGSAAPDGTVTATKVTRAP